jgi:hypothetical protein
MSQPNYLTHHIEIRTTLANPNNFVQTITLDFDPDEVIVRSVGSFIAAAQAGVYEIRSSLVNNRALGHFIDNDTTITGSPSHRLFNFTNNSQYDFSVYDINGAVSTLAGVQLMIHLEFRKYFYRV